MSVQNKFTLLICLLHNFVCSNCVFRLVKMLLVVFAAGCLRLTFRDGIAATKRLAGSLVFWGKPFA